MSTRVLLVDDSPEFLKSLGRVLHASYDLTTASRFEEALALIQRTRFAVIVTDLRATGEDGGCLIDEASRVCPATQFIMHTGKRDDRTLEAVENDGRIAALLAKPSSAETIEAAISDAMEKHLELCRAVVQGVM